MTQPDVEQKEKGLVYDATNAPINAQKILNETQRSAAKFKVPKLRNSK